MGSNTPSSPGNFSYPPPGSTLQFNYIDSVVTSWLSFDSDATESYLSVWYWPNADPWTIGKSKLRPKYCRFAKLDLELPIHVSDVWPLTGYPHHPQVLTKLLLQTALELSHWISSKTPALVSSTFTTSPPMVAYRESLARSSTSILCPSPGQ